jgi:hypothetical protein
MSGLLEELADLAELPVDGFGSDGEQGSEGHLRQAQPVVQGGAGVAARSRSARVSTGRRPVPGVVRRGR